MKKLLTTTCITACAIALLSMPARAETFSPEQKKAIEGIVREYLLKNPEILIEMSARLRQKEEEAKRKAAQAALKAHGKEIFQSPLDPVAGNPKGKKVVVEFFDYNCPYCARALKNLQKLVAEDKEVKVIFKEFPILSEGSAQAAQVALAARKQGDDKYWKLHQQLLEYPGRKDGKVARKLAEKLGLDMQKLEQDMNSEEVLKALAINQQLASALAIEGTPAFVVKGKVVRGAVPYDELKKAVEESVKAQGGKAAGKK